VVVLVLLAFAVWPFESRTETATVSVAALVYRWLTVTVA
jgi:hypothetical protein